MEQLLRIVSVMTGAALGGAEFAAVEMLDALIGRGHQVTMLSDSPGIGRNTRVEVHPLALGAKLSASTWLGLAAGWPLLGRQLGRALEAELPYDVLLLHYKKEQLLASRLPPALRPQIVWAEWGPLPRQMRHGPGRWAYAAASRSADPVLAISDGTRHSLIEAGSNAGTVAVVPNAIRTDGVRFSADGRARVRRELDIASGAFVVGCTSRFHPKKRIDVVIDAVAELDDAHIVLAGEGTNEAELRARAAPLGGRAHFLPTPGDAPGDLFSAFDVSVFCPGPTEGSPTAVVLAMLAGRPCIATAGEGAVGLIERDTGAILSPENDPSALAALLRDYEADPERVRHEGEQGAKRARERFDATAVAEQVEWLILQARSPDGNLAVVG